MHQEGKGPGEFLEPPEHAEQVPTFVRMIRELERVFGEGGEFEAIRA
jgi:hypothetical protein